MTKKEVEKWCEENGYMLFQVEAKISNETIQNLIVKIMGLGSVQEMYKSRKEKNAFARWLYFDYLRKDQHLSLLQIGSMCGGKDHATVLYGLRQLESPYLPKYQIIWKEKFQSQVNELRKHFNLKPLYK